MAAVSGKGNGSERGGYRGASLSIDPVLLPPTSVTPELMGWLRERAVRNSVPVEQQIREELEEHRRYCVRDRARRSA